MISKTQSILFLFSLLFVHSLSIVTIDSEGSSFDAAAIAQFAQDFDRLTQGSVKVVFKNTTAQDAINNLLARSTNSLFVCSDDPLTQSEFDSAPSQILHIPLFIRVTPLIFNVPGISEIKLSPTALALVLQRNITFWNDPILVALNPDLQNISQPILIVKREQPAPSTLLISQYLSQTAPEWTMGIGDVLSWPNGTIGAQTAQGVANLVYNHTYSIGYTTSPAAESRGLDYISLLNTKTDQYIRPEKRYLDAVSALIPSNLPRPEESWANVSLINYNSTYVYPIIGLSFMIFYKNQTANGERGVALREFMKWTMSPYMQAGVPVVASSAISDKMITQNLASIESINVDPNYANNIYVDSCFSGMIAQPITSVQLCPGVAQTVTTDEFVVTFTEDSVPPFIPCQTLMLEKFGVSKYYRTFNETQTLSLSFFPVHDGGEDDQPYLIGNNKSIPIIQIIGEAFFIDWILPLPVVHVCLALNSSQEREETFDTLDFGMVKYPSAGGYNFQALNFPVPQEVIVTEMSQNGINYLCGNISVEGGMTVAVFPIYRRADWHTESTTLLDTESYVMSFILGVIFALSALFAFIRVIYSIVRASPKTVGPWFQTFAMSTAFLFLLLRSIYFFLLPNSVITDQITDYILAVLPTFLYFTTFTVALSVWGTIAVTDSVSKRDQLVNLVFKCVLGVNAFIYVIFIVCMVGYSISADEPTNIEVCGVSLTQVQLETSGQRAVSYFYASILFILSVVDGFLFFYFGLKISRQLKTGSSKQRFFYNSSFLSISFVLHAIFILVLMIVTDPISYFSFFGLILTEVFPGVTFIYVSFRNDVSSSHRQGGSGSQPMSASQSGKKSGKSDKGKTNNASPTSKENSSSVNMSPPQTRKNNTQENSGSDSSSKMESSSNNNLVLNTEPSKNDIVSNNTPPVDSAVETELQSV